MKRLGTIAIVLIAVGALINIADAYTAAGKAEGGYFYGPGGVLKGLNDVLPINFGLVLMLTGGGLIAYGQLA